MDGQRLRERESELDRLADALADAADGSGRVVVIEGAGGIGKSRLLLAARELRRRACGSVGNRLRARTQLRFGVVLQLFAGVVRARPGLLDGAAALAAPLFDPARFAPAPGQDTLFSRLHGLSWLLVNLAGRRAARPAGRRRAVGRRRQPARARVSRRRWRIFLSASSWRCDPATSRRCRSSSGSRRRRISRRRR